MRTIYLLSFFVFAIILLSFLKSLNNLEALKRDYQRKSDISQIKLALEMYYDDHQGNYPKINEKSDLKNWSVLKKMLEGEYLTQLRLDPLNNKRYNYRYQSIDGKKYYFNFKLERLRE